MAAFRFSFLGSPHLERDGLSVKLSSTKALALLAYLAITRTSHTRAQVLALLWPESLEEAARKNLRNTLWLIRRELGNEVIKTDGNRLSLASTPWVDVHELEQQARDHFPIHALQPIAELVPGPLLAGVSLAAAPEWEIWLAMERERVGQLILRWLAAAISRQKQSGNWREVIALARYALIRDNLQEPMYCALMEAHAQLGERAEALRQYEILRLVLDKELGVSPLAETEALKTAILQNSLLLPLLSVVTPPPARSKTEPARIPFVGRQNERVHLDQTWQVTLKGQCRILLLTGELGIGKSRLWQEWSVPLPLDVVVLETRCLAVTQPLPLAPLVALISQWHIQQRLFTPPAALPAVWLAEMTRLAPEIRHSFPNLPIPVALPPEEEQRRLFEALSQCVLAFQPRPIVLFLDDLQWADQTTLDWLGYLVNRLSGRQLFIVGAYRPEDAPISLNRLVLTWERDGLAQRLPLARLTWTEAEHLAAALHQNAPFQRAVQQSAGNPYFLIELCRATQDDLPLTLAELVQDRLDRLPDGAKQVLQAAAVLEPDFDFATLRRASGRSEEETLDALDILLRADIISEEKRQYIFTHPLFATVVRDRLSGARRAFLYRRAAEALEKTYAGRLPPVAGRLATCYEEAEDIIQAAHYAQLAAQYALDLTAPAEAVAFYRHALALEPTPERELGLGRALHQQGELNEAQQVLEAAWRGFITQDDIQGATQACVTLGDTYLRSGQFDHVFEWGERALTLLASQANAEVEALVYHTLGAAALHSQRSLSEAEQYLTKAAKLAQNNHLPEIAARSRFGLAGVLAQRNDLAGAVATYQEVISLTQQAEDPFHEILAYNNVAHHALLLGDLSLAHQYITQGLALAEARALTVLYQWLYSTRGEIALAESRWDEAEKWFQFGLSQAEKHHNAEMIATCEVNLALVTRGRGDYQEALRRLQSAHDMIAPSPLQIQIDLYLAECFLATGDKTAAQEALSRAEANMGGNDRGRLRAWANRLRKE